VERHHITAISKLIPGLLNRDDTNERLKSSRSINSELDRLGIHTSFGYSFDIARDKAAPSVLNLGKYNVVIVGPSGCRYPTIPAKKGVIANTIKTANIDRKTFFIGEAASVQRFPPTL